MKKIIRLIILLVVASCIFSALAVQAADVPRNRTLIIAQGFDPVYLWPNGSTASTNLNAGAAIVESFMYTNVRTGEMEPLLAESWEWKSPTALQLNLRQGVKFTNGEPMNAEAAKFSLEVFMDPKITPAYSRYAKPLDHIEIVDEHTIIIHTKDPYPAMFLTLYRAFVVPPKYWREVGGADGFNQKPIGTGPFMLTEWIKDDRLVMDKNPDFWGEAPKGIDRVIWKPVPDDTARAAGLETGEYDLAASISVNSVDRIKNHPDLQLISGLSYRVYAVRLSCLEKDPGPIHDKRVRQALNYAVDKQSIVDNLFFGQAKVLQGQTLFEGQFGFNPNLKPYPYDPEKAKQLLAEAGYPDGFEVSFKFPSGRYAQDREVAEAVAGMLAKVGVKCKMTVLEPGEYLKQLRIRELGPLSFGGSAAPARSPLHNFHVSFRLAIQLLSKSGTR